LISIYCKPVLSVEYNPIVSDFLLYHNSIEVNDED